MRDSDKPPSKRTKERSNISLITKKRKREKSQGGFQRRETGMRPTRKIGSGDLGRTEGKESTGEKSSEIYTKRGAEKKRS